MKFFSFLSVVASLLKHLIGAWCTQIQLCSRMMTKISDYVTLEHAPLFFAGSDPKPIFIVIKVQRTKMAEGKGKNNK